jgi:hypothetical protein
MKAKSLLRMVAPSIAMVAVMAASQSALAQAALQTAPPPGATPVPAGPPATNVTVTAPTRPAPTANLLGVPVQADAPVSPSYDSTAYKTLGGQAETGQDAIAGQVMQPQGAGPH